MYLLTVNGGIEALEASSLPLTPSANNSFTFKTFEKFADIRYDILTTGSLKIFISFSSSKTVLKSLSII